MMRIRWTPAAAADLQRISEYLKEHNPHYREPTLQKLYATIRALKNWPGRGRPGSEEGTREILFPPLPYVAVHRANEQTNRSSAHLSRRTGLALTPVTVPQRTLYATASSTLKSRLVDPAR
jgi:toxin ParE1/3/4